MKHQSTPRYLNIYGIGVLYFLTVNMFGCGGGSYKNQSEFTDQDTVSINTYNLSEDEEIGESKNRLNKRFGESDANVLRDWALKEIARADVPFCWKSSYGRTAGVPLSQCPGMEKNGLLCYPKCRNGYAGAGPVCWKRCPGNFTDTGAHCLKPEPYGRGAGYPWTFGDPLDDSGMFRRCEKDHGRGNCEKNGLIVYPKCRSGFHPVGCCICSPNCPSDMVDIGVSCQKPSYGRGAGVPMSCRSDEELNGALCYPWCRSGFYGVGPVCWQHCPSTQPFSCAAGCTAQESQCVGETISMVLAPLEMVATLVGTVVSGGTLTAAKASIKAAIKTGSKAAIKKAVNQAIKQIAKEVLGKVRTVTQKRLLKKYSKDIAEDVMVSVAESLAVSALYGEADLKDTLISADPTGIASVVDVFNKPICSQPTDPPVLPQR